MDTGSTATPDSPSSAAAGAATVREATRRKDRPRVLILDGQSKAAASTVIALGEHCTLDVAAPTGADCVSLASPRVARRLIQPDAVEALAPWLQAQDAEAAYDLIIPSTEASLVGVKLQSIAPALRAKMVLADEASIDIALDKHLTCAAAQELGLPVPAATLVRNAAEIPALVRLPVAIKPQNSKVWSGGRVQSLTVRICRDAAERDAAYRDLLPYTPVVEQEYFQGRGVGVELLFEHGQPRWSFAHERIHEMPITGGGSTYRRAVTAPPAVEAAAIALMRHLRWHGVAMVEFKVADNGDFRIVEINPRLWGSLPLAVAAGVNFPLGLLRMAQGLDPGPQPDYRRGFYARSIGADLRWFAMSLARPHPLAVKRVGADDFLGLLRPLIGTEHWDLFRWREPQMWWAMTRRSLQKIGSAAGRRARPAALAD